MGWSQTPFVQPVLSYCCCTGKLGRYRFSAVLFWRFGNMAVLFWRSAIWRYVFGGKRYLVFHLRYFFGRSAIWRHFVGGKRYLDFHRDFLRRFGKNTVLFGPHMAATFGVQQQPQPRHDIKLLLCTAVVALGFPSIERRLYPESLSAILSREARTCRLV